MFSHPRYSPRLLSVHFKDLHAAPQRKSTIYRKRNTFEASTCFHRTIPVESKNVYPFGGP